MSSEIKLENTHIIQEDLIKVEELPFIKFDVDSFYKKYNISAPPENKKLVTAEQAREELLKITNVTEGYGFAYFFLEYCVVSHPTLGKIILKDDVYKWQMLAAQSFVSQRFIVSLKSRQVAFSTTVGAYSLWRALFFDSQRIAIISKNQADSITFLERVKFIYDHLPVWLKQQTSEFAKTYVTFAHNFSKITSLPNRGDPGQGESLSLLVLDEFASYQNQQAVLSAATPALSAGALTKFTNTTLPSQLFVISTLPRNNVVDNEFLRILHGAQDNPNSRYKLIDVEVDDILHYRDRSWHLEQLETLGPRGYKIEILKQEVFETEHSLIESFILLKIQETIENPIRCDFVNPESIDEEGYFRDLNVFANMREEWDSEYKYLKGLWIWEDSIPEKEYIVICDVAGGEANDFSAFHVIDLENNIQVAEYKGKVNTEQYKEAILAVCEYYNEAKLSVERTGLGINICQYFGDTINYENLYWHQKSKHNYISGFPMVNPIRAHAIAFMENYLTREEITIKSVRLLNELRNFGMTPRGKIKAISGNDDLVMALAQFCYLQEKGWAVADSLMEGEYDNIGEIEDIDPEVIPNKASKYWEENFDLSDEQRELLKLAKLSGSAISDDFFR